MKTRAATAPLRHPRDRTAAAKAADSNPDGAVAATGSEGNDDANDGSEAGSSADEEAKGADSDTTTAEEIAPLKKKQRTAGPKPSTAWCVFGKGKKCCRTLLHRSSWKAHFVKFYLEDEKVAFDHDKHCRFDVEMTHIERLKMYSDEQNYGNVWHFSVPNYIYQDLLHQFA